MMPQDKPAVLEMSPETLSPLMEECLEAGQQVVLTITGNSMAPFLRHHRDRVVLVKPADVTALQVGDVPLYRRANGQLLLHRIVERDDGCCRQGFGIKETLPSLHVGQPLTYTLCGDAQAAVEPNIQPQQILAVAVAFWRKGKRWECASTSYQARVVRWYRWMPLRVPLMWLYHLPLCVQQKWGFSKEK